LGLTLNQSWNAYIRNDFKNYYDEFHVVGSFALYDQNNDKWTFYNQQQFKQPMSPASTFKICNSLIGLETNVITDENFIIPWNGIANKNLKWNSDQNLESAF
jgi:beta-lactamase class D